MAIKWHHASSQMGAKEGQVCIEQVMVLRLLYDKAKLSENKLYVLFIGFIKAYSGFMTSE